jgi:hypothetical protein
MGRLTRGTPLAVILVVTGLGVDGEQLEEARAAEIAFLEDVAERSAG